MKNQKMLFAIPLMMIAMLSGCSTGKSESPTEINVPVEATVRSTSNAMFCHTPIKEAETAYNNAIKLEKSDPVKAEESYLQAIELDPKFCDAMDNLGVLLRRKGDFEGAISWYQKSLEIAPQNEVAMQNIALAYSLQGQLENAAEWYAKLIETAPANPEGYFGLGNMYYKLEQPEKAIVYLKKADELYIESGSPYRSDAEYYLGFSYFMLADCTNARVYLEPIYNQFESDGGTNYVLGVCYATSEPKNIKLAKEYIQKAQAQGIEIPADVLNAIK
jgi:tetratricopeptide (TPR) repeat protein